MSPEGIRISFILLGFAALVSMWTMWLIYGRLKRVEDVVSNTEKRFYGITRGPKGEPGIQGEPGRKAA